MITPLDNFISKQRKRMAHPICHGHKKISILDSYYELKPVRLDDLNLTKGFKTAEKRVK